MGVEILILSSVRFTIQMNQIARIFAVQFHIFSYEPPDIRKT